MNRFRWQPIAGARIREEGKAQPLSPSLEDRVAEHWAAEESGRTVPLVDAPIFNVTRVVGDGFVGHYVPYRRWVAQLREPALREILRVQPGSVCAVTRAGGALVFGRRSPHTTQDPDCWEPVPAGGIGEEARLATGEIDAARQLVLEFEEELGVERRDIRSLAPVALVVDLETRVHDLVFAVDLAFDADALARRFDGRPTAEVGALHTATPTQLAAWLRDEAPALAPISDTLLEVDARCGPGRRES